MYKAKMRCLALLVIMLSMVSCGQNAPEQNTSEVTEEMIPNTITTTAASATFMYELTDS